MKTYKTVKILVINIAKEDILCTSGEAVVDNEITWNWNFTFQQ